MNQVTTRITPFTTTPSRQKPLTFSADMDTRLSEENSRIEAMNNMSDEMNKVANDINARDLSISNMKNDIDATYEDIKDKKTDIDNKYEEIQQYVIPEEATYSEETIEKKLRMNQILVLTNSI